MEKGHLSIQRGVSWSPGGLTKPLQLKQDMHTSDTDYNASWEKTGFNKERTNRKTSECYVTFSVLIFSAGTAEGKHVLTLLLNNTEQ